MWHTKKSTEVLEQLQSTTDGLSNSQVTNLLEEYGPNVLEKQKKQSAFQLFIQQFKSFIIYILLFAIIISIASGEWVDAIVILIILLFNAIFGFIQEYRANKAIDALKKMAAFKVDVIRNGKTEQIDAEVLVPGDIIVLGEGNKIPADAYLLDAKNLQVVEAALTGESVASSKKIGKLREKTPLAERDNMVYCGTSITRGKALAVVVETGMQTELGKIAGMLNEVEDEQTPLQKQLDVMGKRIGVGTIIICVVIMILGVIHSLQDPTQLWPQIHHWLLVSVSLAVAAVPEGLPAVVTIALAIGVKKMLKRNSLIRKLPSVETLGEATIICSDKTGTITTNQMTVRSMFTLDNLYELSGSGYSAKGTITPKPKLDAKLLLTIGKNCNDAKLFPHSTASTSQISGDPTEAALLVSAKKANTSSSYTRIDEIPFDSERKLMSTLHKTPKGLMQYTKGAPEKIISICDRVLINGKVRKLTPKYRNEILQTNSTFASHAMRVLGFAYAPRKKLSEKKLIFVGLQGMIDPPHPEVKSAVETCHTAGIRVMMITGDNKETALAIAKEIGLRGGAMEGEEFARLPVAEQKKQIKHLSVFARVEPRHKMHIVSLLQQMGEIVAMTGDGVNDAPAIRKADLGISMGISGTDVSKEASKMVLMDDNFTSIVGAIEEGRGIYQNIKKFVNYLLSCNLGEVFVIFFAILFGWDLPMTAIMLLWLNLVTDGLPALALAVDPYGKNLMKAPPLKKNAQIMDKSMVFAIFFVSFIIAIGVLGLFWWGGETYGDLAHMQTLAFTGIIVMEIVRLQAIRSEYKIGMFSNLWLIGAVLASIGLQLLVIYTPLAVHFGTVPLNSVDWFMILSVSAVIWGLNTFAVAIRRRIFESNSPVSQ